MVRRPRLLLEFPVIIRVRCDRCKRYGQYNKWRLMKRLRPNLSAEEVIWLLAHSKCAQPDRKKRCVAYFLDFSVRGDPSPPHRAAPAFSNTSLRSNKKPAG
jgi:hypothetical protein